MRHIHLAFLTLAGCLTLAAAGPKDVVYLNGNLDGIDPATAATLDLTSSKTMVLEMTGKKVEIPYLAITGSEAKVVEVVIPEEPLYKFWNLRYKLLPPTPNHEVTLKYDSGKGKPATMTLQVSPSVAKGIETRLAQAVERRATLNGEWWGDSLWKTKRNESEWKTKQWDGSSEVAQRE